MERLAAAGISSRVPPHLFAESAGGSNRIQHSPTVGTYCGRSAGDEDTAALRLGWAVALAHESGNEDTAKLLAKVVDVIDPATGTVRLKAKVADADEMTLDTRSTKTVRARKYPDRSISASGP